jgi:hypothetical protein
MVGLFDSPNNVRAARTGARRRRVGWWRESLAAPMTSLDCNDPHPSTSDSRAELPDNVRFIRGAWGRMGQRPEELHEFQGQMRVWVPDPHVQCLGLAQEMQEDSSGLSRGIAGAMARWTRGSGERRHGQRRLG